MKSEGCDVLNVLKTSLFLRALEEIHKLGGNAILERLIQKLSLVYRKQEEAKTT